MAGHHRDHKGCDMCMDNPYLPNQDVGNEDHDQIVNHSKKLAVEVRWLKELTDHQTWQIEQLTEENTRQAEEIKNLRYHVANQTAESLEAE